MEQPASDFDGAWKYALEQYFAPFLALFFPEAHAAINWSQPVAFRDTELQQIAPEDQAGKQRVDKLVQVRRLDGEPAWVFVHVEVQSRAPCKVVSVVLPMGSQDPTLAWA